MFVRFDALSGRSSHRWLRSMSWACAAMGLAVLSVNTSAQDGVAEVAEEPAANAVADVHEHGDGTHHDHDHAAPAEPTDPYAAGPDAEGFESFEQRVSYAIGASMGGQMAREFAELDFNVDARQFGRGFGDAADETAQGVLSEEQLRATLTQFQQEMQMRQFAKIQESMNADSEFLETNATAEGVVATESGVQYRITEAGGGPKPQPTDTVLVHYEGKLLDGTVFDSSIARGEPVPFPLDGVIPGFQAGLTQMPVGSKGTLFIPGDQAYGMQPPPGSPIGPNQLLIFDVELIEVVEQSALDMPMLPEFLEEDAPQPEASEEVAP